jgi:hypothetical protein
VKHPARGIGWWAARLGALAVLGALLYFTIEVTAKPHATDTENALWTFILFAVGILLSYYFGRQSVEEAAADLVRPQARSAARRLVTLGRGVKTVSVVIEMHRDAAADLAATNHGDVSLEHVNLALDSLTTYVNLQLLTIADALEDWRQFDTPG